MSRFTLTPDAEADLVEIIDYIARDSPSAAVKVRNKIHATLEQLAEMPGIGHFREELLDRRYRFSSVYSYVIAYRCDVTPLQVIAIVHGARNLDAFFRRRTR